jgi:hypothetical protein
MHDEVDWSPRKFIEAANGPALRQLADCIILLIYAATNQPTLNTYLVWRSAVFSQEVTEGNTLLHEIFLSWGPVT